MNSHRPLDDQKKPGLRDKMRTGARRLKEAFKSPAASPRLPPGKPEPLATPNIGSSTETLSGSVTPLPAPGPPATVDTLMSTLHPEEPSTQAPAPEAEFNAATEDAESGSVAWRRLFGTLKKLESGLELFPPLKSAVGALVGCLDVVEAAASNRTDYGQLALEFQSMADTLNQFVGEFESEPRNGSIANIAQCIQARVEDIKRKRKRGTTGKLLDAFGDQEDVIRRYRQLDRLFRQLQSDLSTRTRNDVKKQLEITLLGKMSPVGDAKYNSGYSTTIRRRGCTSETREAIQKNLQDWTTNTGSERIYWMNGMAGTGKTTIAYSFCEWLEETNRLGASFFCSRISSTCRSLNQIVPTIAYQLAHFSPAFRSKLCAALNDSPDAGDLNVVQQFEKLIHRPMLDAKAAIPDGVVIVIDALDECDDAFSVRLLLEVLLKFAEQLPLKFFVASRPEHVIRDRMMSQGGATRSIVHLHDIEQSIVQEDIKKYLTEALSTMSPPPTPMQIRTLAERAGKLFIYAATVVRYINPEIIPVESSFRLEIILTQTKDPEAEGDSIYEDLDRLYTTVLNAVLSQSLGRREKDRMKRVLWTVVCAREPITASTIASLSSLTEPQVLSSLQSLRSVLHVPEESGLISALHASFPEYMLDQSRSKELYCDELQSNKALVHRCFEVMESELRFNICNLESSYLTNDQIADLDTRVDRYISSTLSYACRYWGKHLELSPTLDQTRDMLANFLFNQILFWMEVLSLRRCIGIGAPMLQQVQSWLQKNGSTPDEFQKLVADTRNFLTWFAANPCSRSTPHIYISALPLCAKSNLVRQHYSKGMQGLVNVTSQRDDATLAIWSAESEITTIAISFDGGRITAGHGDGKIHVYDMHTGAIIVGPFKGHTSSVQSVAFSPDGTQIASMSGDGTIIIWDAQAGSVTIGPLDTHTSWGCSVVFSSDGSRIISGGHSSIYVWDTRTGSIIIGPLEGSTLINSIAVSKDGRLIASGLSDRTVRFWDANTGIAVGKPFEGHKDTVWAIAFSPDGTRIASGSQDKTIRIWDLRASTIVGLPLEAHNCPIGSLSFSSDGTMLASGGWGIMIWDIETYSPIASYPCGPSGWIRSVVFSPDNTRVVAGWDTHIRIWDVQKNSETVDQRNAYEASVGQLAFFPNSTRFISNSSSGVLRAWDFRTGSVIPDPFQGQVESNSINSVSISPQGTRIAASTSDFTIRVWDVVTGDMVCDSLRGHQGSVGCISFSPDSTYICSGSDDFTIIIWDVEAGVMVGRPYEGHQGAIRSIIYSHDGALLVSGSDDHSVRIWDPTTGALVHTLEGHEASVLSAVFSLDGNQVISGSADGTIRKWDVGAGKSSGVLFELPNRSTYSPDLVSCICISPGGNHLISGFGSIIRIFDIQTTDIISVLSLAEHEAVHWVGFSSNGTDILSVSVLKTENIPRVTEETIEQPPQRSNIIRVWRKVPPLGQPDSSSHSSYWSYKRDGQILSPEGFVAWVPPDLIPLLEVNSKSYYNPLVLSSDGVIDLGYEDLCIGSQWAQCYTN